MDFLKVCFVGMFVGGEDDDCGRDYLRILLDSISHIFYLGLPLA